MEKLEEILLKKCGNMENLWKILWENGKPMEKSSENLWKKLWENGKPMEKCGKIDNLWENLRGNGKSMGASIFKWEKHAIHR